MTDIADESFKQIEQFINDGINLKKPENKLKPIGECHYCGEPFTSRDLNKLFCSNIHAEEYEREEFLRKQNIF